MAKEIALSIKVNVNGTEKVVSNIQETEAAVKALREELATTSYGTDRFNKITADLQKLRAQLENVDKATEGLGMEKRLRAINDATNLLTGSFSLLTGALTLASANEEDLLKVQQAEAKAMGAVNIILGARAISEALLESRVLRREAAEKLSLITSKAYIATAKGISATLNSIGISAGVASTGVRVLTSALAALGIPALIAGLGLLYEYLTDVNDEFQNKAPLDAKEYYDEVKKSIDGLNTANQIRLDNFKASGADEKSVLQQNLRDKQETYDKLKEEEKDLWSKYEMLRGQALNNEDKFYSKAKTNLLNRAKAVKENIDKILEDTIKADTDLKNASKDLTDFEKKQEDERAKKAKETADKIKAIKLKEISDKLAAQLKYVEYLKQLGGQEIKVDAEVIERVKKIIDDQNALLDVRAENAKSAKDKLEEQLNIDLFKVIPSESEKRLFEDSFLDLFNTLNEGLKKDGKDIVSGANKTLDELISIVIKIADADPINVIMEDKIPLLREYDDNAKRIIEINKQIEGSFDGSVESMIRIDQLTEELDKLKKAQEGIFTEESRKAITNYFNLINTYTDQLSGKKIENIFGVQIDEGQALGVIKNIISQTQKVLTDETILPGDFTRILTDQVKEQFKTLGLVAKEIQPGLDDVSKAKIDAYNKKLEELIAVFVSLGQSSANTIIDVERVGKELKNLTEISRQNEEQLKREGKYIGEFVDLTAAEFDNAAKKIRQTAGESPQAFTEFVNDLITNAGKVQEVVDETGRVVVEGVAGTRDKYLSILSPDRLIKLLQEGAKGLKDVNFENEKQITDLITNLTQLELQLGDSITTTIQNIDGTTEVVGSGYASFIEIIDALKKKLKELQEETKETGKTFEETFSESKFKKIADIILTLFTDISGRISEISGQQSSLMLEKLAYEQEATLAIIGEANTENKKENEKIAKERLKIEKQYAKEKFDIEKKARIQELQFGLANAISQSAQAIINAFATLPPAAAIPYALILGGITAAQIAVINDQIQFTQSKAFIGRRGGLIQGDTHEDGGVPALLEGGEFVMSRAAVDTYGDTLGMMNASVGSRALAIDDSRIVQAIAKQNTATKVPLKTYVLYNDIQNTEKLNNKIEQLARL